MKFFFLLNIPRPTASGIITKWKQLGTATRPQTEWGQRIVKCAEVTNCLQSK
ncbi:unnamed protein product [Staurois parvus]|uniref:Uncharacterized protein n=1 Tax=Staurois parvus TaxID=386267 RepID=A0ABN9F4H1_9NEOB|nr:unnamed protein product [Staurois parvus]